MERASLAQREQPQNVVHVGAGEKDGGDGRIARRTGMWRQFRICARLDGQIRRGIDQEPIPGAIADGDGRLSLRWDVTVSGLLAIGAGAVPLRQASACGNP